MMAGSRLRFWGAALAASVVLSGCTIDTIDTTESSGPPTSTVTLTSTPTSPPAAEAPVLPTEEPQQGESFAQALQAAVDQTIAVYGGTAGIAVSDGSTEVTAGDMSAAAAWSTIKVPLAIAAVRQDPAQTTNVTAAIQWSDNNAAEALWASLGTPEQAGQATTDILREGRNDVTVNTVVTRDGFSSFGQTMWSPADQARFAATLGCIRGSEPVLQNMAMVEPGQSWGIGQLPGARFKGGWGPQSDGAYSVRQFGLSTNPTSGQTTALAIIVRPGSGSFADAQAMADTLISTVQPALAQAPASAC